jgi:hypothetical protein
MGRSVMINEFSVAANVTTNDVITAAGYNAYFGAAAKITFYGGADAVGMQHALFSDDGQLMTGIVPPGSGLGTLSTAGKVKTNEDFIHMFAISSGSKLLWNLTNTTGAPIKSNALFMVE